MLTLLIVLVTWMIIGAIIIVPGVTLIWTDYEIDGFSMKLAMMILILGPFFWLCIVMVFIAFLLDMLLS